MSVEINRNSFLTFCFVRFKRRGWRNENRNDQTRSIANMQIIRCTVQVLNAFLYRIKIGCARNPLQGTVLVCYVPVPEPLLGVLALRMNLDSRLLPRKTVLTSIATVRIIQQPECQSISANSTARMGKGSQFTCHRYFLPFHQPPQTLLLQSISCASHAFAYHFID